MQHPVELEPGGLGTPVTRAQMLRSTASVIVAGGVLAPLLGCGKSSPSGAAAGGVKRGGTVQWATDQLFEGDSLDPMKSINDGQGMANGLLREGLSTYDPDQVPIPRLAEWTANADFTEFTLTMRRGAKFHDGTPFTAKDAEWTIKRQLDPDLGSQIQARLSASLDPSGVTVVDNSTLKLKLKRPDSLIMAPLARTVAYIVPAGTTDFGKGIGTGPFKLVNWSPGQSFEVTANREYWMPGIPYLAGVRAVQIPEPSTKTNSVLSGPSHITEIDYQSLPLVKSNKAVELTVLKSAMLLNVVMDQSKEPFTDVRVREAMKRAVDREKLIEVAYAGYGTSAADAPAPANDPLFPTDLRPRLERDVDGARKLMDEAGFPDGLTLTLHTVGDPIHSTFALAFAASLADSPFTINVKQHPGATYWSKTYMNVNFFVSDWNRRHPLEAMSQMLATTASGNEPRFDDKKLDVLLAKGYASGGAKQKDAIDQALILVSETSGDVIPGYRDRVAAVKRAVQGSNLSTVDVVDFRKVWLAS